MRGMLRRDTGLVACTVTNCWGRMGWDTASATIVGSGRQSEAQRGCPRPIPGEAGRLGLHAEEVAEHDDGHDQHEQGRDGEDELEGDDASVVATGSE